MATKTSFQKKTRVKGFQIAGTRPSLHNNQLLISTGIPSLDNVFGGGIAVGTVVLIEEDTYSSYSRLMLKYYVAEGVMSQHALLIASPDPSPEKLIKDLPGAIVDDPVADQAVLPPGDAGSGSKPAGAGDADDSMKIAWRYQNKPQVQSSPGIGTSQKFGHYYDLTKTMDEQILRAANISNFNPLDEFPTESKSDIMQPTHSALLLRIKEEIDKGQFATGGDPKQHKNILRIAIHSLGSPLWGCEGGINTSTGKIDPSLCRFLYALRALMRTSFSTCMITIPTHLFHDLSVTRRVEHLCDTVIGLDSFVGSDKEKNPAFKEYHGLFNIIKLPRLNTLQCHMPDTLDLAFKLKRKKFMIERLHLPPELSETVSRDQEDPVLPKQSQTGCGSGASKSKLDF